MQVRTPKVPTLRLPRRKRLTISDVSQWRERLGLPVTVNDIHSQLNETQVRKVLRPISENHVAELVRKSPVAISGGRHAMGGQAFATGETLLDMRGMNRIISVDESRGRAIVEAGIQWPDLYKGLDNGDEFHWTFRQKQTGGDRLTVGGSLAANIHSRGLTMKPMVDDVESFQIVVAGGEIKRVSRNENADLWRLAIGGYGLFGVVTAVELRLVKRFKVRRRVQVRRVAGLAEAFADRIAEGYTFGDFQFAIDPDSDGFLDEGVFACYEPVDGSTPIKADQRKVPRAAWHHLAYLAHERKAEAFQQYRKFYESTDGQIYWSDQHQMTAYLDDYHAKLDRRLKAPCKGSELITELYVPRPRLEAFLAAARREMRQQKANVIYGTIRWIEPDTETLLAWAREPWACIIFNLHVDHDAAGLDRARGQFRTLIDLALAEGGTFYLTYHRWASKEQIERAYPAMDEFLAEKQRRDPYEWFTSDWYRHLKATMAS